MTPHAAAGDARLRDLTAEDLPWMAQAEREMFGAGAWSPELIDHDFRYGYNRYRGIEVGGELAGYAVYGYEGDAFHLMNVAVLPAFRRRGLARMVMDEFLAEAERLKAPDAWLEVAVPNEGARALYDSYGFETVRVRRKYYQPGDVDALVMRLMLRPFAPGLPGSAG